MIEYICFDVSFPKPFPIGEKGFCHLIQYGCEKALRYKVYKMDTQALCNGSHGDLRSCYLGENLYGIIMTIRDDFSDRAKEQVNFLSGYRCSDPNCREKVYQPGNKQENQFRRDSSYLCGITRRAAL